MYGRANGSDRGAFRMYHAQFPDEYWSVEFLSDYMTNLVKQVRSTSQDIKLVYEELHAV